MTDLNELLERVKKATGGDRALDIAIARQTGDASLADRNPDHDGFIMTGSKLDKLIPHFTASIDAALALVERVLPNTMKRVCDDENGTPRAELVTESMGYAREHGATWPLAILAALLTALISKEAQS